MSLNSIKELLLKQIEHIAQSARYDMVYEQNDSDQLLVQIIKRDDNGGIIGTPLSLDIVIDEDRGNGEVVFYHSKGEFKRQEFDVYKEGSLLDILVHISQRLNIN
ncbi:hypothetical protein U8V72_11295 [Priestia filamentosa]|uniref:hypothetical protein n=1 Tax=Priestia filamentosa TaxID=1402861 RepID=UPI00397D4237